MPFFELLKLLKSIIKYLQRYDIINLVFSLSAKNRGFFAK